MSTVSPPKGFHPSSTICVSNAKGRREPTNTKKIKATKKKNVVDSGPSGQVAAPTNPALAQAPTQGIFIGASPEDKARDRQ